ncbi:MAG: 16S rRNA (guanine(527)-N(7))-methyltransferase RsmG [Chloroflexota bacterium]|nr:MAG: 16S rRNA (guanine(527)-N(7))-methyltransferase RsmG [Chloroflexota bacterium]
MGHQLIMQTLMEGARRWGIELSAVQVEQFRLYYEDLVAWNKRINLTAITEPEAAQSRHFLDSLSLLRLNQPHNGFYRWNGGPLLTVECRMADVGAGAGFPGLALKIARPDLRLCLVESVGKKAVFLRHVADSLGFEDVEIVVERAETLGRDVRYRNGFDVVLARGVAALRALTELCLPLTRQGGFFVAYKKGQADDEVRDAQTALGLLGGQLCWKEEYELPGMEGEHALLVIQKTSATPDRFPRQPGIPTKRPL